MSKNIQESVKNRFSSLIYQMNVEYTDLLPVVIITKSLNTFVNPCSFIYYSAIDDEQLNCMVGQVSNN